MKKVKTEKDFSPLQLQLLYFLRENEPMTCGDIAKIINRPRITVLNNLTILISFGLIKKYNGIRRTQGRPFVFFELKKKSEKNDI